MIVPCALNDATAAIPILRSVSVLIPQARVLNSSSRSPPARAFVGSAEGQWKIIDSVSGELLASGADKRLGGMQIVSATQWRWGDAEEVLKYWSAKTTERLTELKTRGALSSDPARAESSR
jgi:hypothetical protein